MVYVKRKERETTASMLRRFSRRMQQSGVLIRARQSRFYVPKMSKRARRAKALRRAVLAKERQHLMKLGKIKESER